MHSMRSSTKDVGTMRLRRQSRPGRAGEASPAEAPGLREPRTAERGRPETVRAQESERGPVERAPVNRRRAYAWRTRNAGAAAVGTAGAGVLVLARLVMLVASLIALLIALAIVLRDVDANASNTIVKGIHESANFFAGAFTGLIRFNGHAKRAITVDWGIALVAYLIVGGFISRVVARVGRGGVYFERSHRAAPTA
jgi:hypothetical protein